jgi:hypothetical protein
MENIPGDKCDEYGCFVYHVLREIEVRTCKQVDDKSRSGLTFEEGRLVSIDLIRPSRISKSKNGPFLRLTDDSGWLFEKKYGETILQRLSVTTGLWCFYIDDVYDNAEFGRALRCHPCDGSPYIEPNVRYAPMQMIYCDRKVIHPSNGVTSYRVQGTNGWILDKYLDNKGGSSPLMLPDSFVKTGLFAYEMLENIAVRLEPTVSLSDSVSSNTAIRKTEIVCCDTIRSAYLKADAGNGPYLRLTDGTGWIFGKRADHNSKIIKPLTIDNGNWSFQIINEGIKLHRQPIDRKDMTTNILYNPGDRVDCDKQITSSSSGVSFYRVVGTEGWVFNRRRNGDQIMQMLKSKGLTNPEPFALGDDQSPWDVSFIRGMAAAYDLNEISHNTTSRCISFRNNNDRINVYYSTRTIGTALDHPSQGKTQLFRRECTVEDLKKIFQDPRSHTGKGYKRRPSGDGIIREAVHSTPHGRGTYLDEEEYIRNSLIECDARISKLYYERDSILKSIKRHDDRHALVATKMKTKTDDHRKQLAKKTADKVRQEAAADAAAEKERIRMAKSLTCGECYREFSSEQARDQHCRDAHHLQCNYCGKTCKSQNGLNNHRDAVGHW